MQTAVVSMLTLAAVAVLGLVLAYWTWVWFAPRAEPRAEVAVAQTGNLASAGLVFGKVELNKAAAAPTGIAIKLLGVVAASGGRRGHAVVQLEGKQILAVHEGEDVAPGLRLAEVHPEHVMLERGGVRETLAWPQKKGAAPASAQVAQAAEAAQKAAEVVAKPAVVVAPPPPEPVAPRGRRSGRQSSDSD